MDHPIKTTEVAREDRILYRTRPFLKLGVLVQNGICRPWDSSHFVNFNNKFVIRYEGSTAYFYCFTPMHILMEVFKDETIKWFNPCSTDIPFQHTDEEMLVWLAAFRLLSRHFPAWRR